MTVRIRIDKIENAYLVNTPAKTADGDLVDYDYVDYAYYTLDEAIAKVKEVYDVK